MRRWTTMMLVALLAGAAGCTARDKGSGGAGDGGGAVDGGAPRADGPPLAKCSYVASHVCWRCDAKPPGGLVKVGCRAPKDCKLFCSATLAAGYAPCGYLGPKDSPPPCRGWVAPRAPFSSCQRRSDPTYGSIYNCPSCVTANQAIQAATSPDGKCYVFADSCIPAGFKRGGSCSGKP